jgi:leader peptidase (prepilin peptidase)/N-methyltransferase
VAELIPVLSYVVQRGRCRGCGCGISGRYPLVELLFGVVLVLLFRVFVGVEFVIQVFFYGLLLMIFFIDLEHQIIPNRLVLILLAYTLVLQAVYPTQTWTDSLLGGVLGGALFLLLALVSRGGMGGGDIKLVTVLGLWFGWQGLILLMFLAFLGGGVTGAVLLLTGLKKRKDGIPFGPFLVLASFVVTLWGNRLISWYLTISGFPGG